MYRSHVEALLKVSRRAGFPPVIRSFRRALVFFLLIPLLMAQSEKATVADRASVVESLDWFTNSPQSGTEFDYAMTARVRLLFFWAGKDDVGGGYIRHSNSKVDSRDEQISVLFGSDPAKAPRAINRWGAGTEFIRHASEVSSGNSDEVVSSVFFGFMKSSRGKSAGEMQEELKKEKERGEFQFTGILSRVESGHALSLTQPLASNTDFNLHQYDEAESIMLQKLRGSDRPVRALNSNGGCSRNSEFLGTVSELLSVALEKKPSPKSLCYVYDAQIHTLILERVSPVRNLQVVVHSAKGGNLISQTYADLVEAEFVSASRDSSKKTSFTIVIGTKDALRGVPVQIRYQPNWWFQVILNLQSTHSLA
jgi:hypothetical protein